MDQVELFATQQNGTSLFSLAVEFNLYPVRYLHLSWLKKDEHYQIVQQLKSSEATHFNLSNYLLQRFNLRDTFDFNFDSKEKRIAFASSEELSRLAFYLGIILNEGVIRSAVRRKERVALEHCLGVDAYQFAVKKAQFISRMSEQAGPSLLVDWNHLDRFKQYLTTSGLQVIARAYADAPAAFRKRLILKMPKDCYKTLNNPKAVKLNKEQCVRLMLKTHREVNRQWRHLLS